jgi:hypothetical protein
MIYGGTIRERFEDLSAMPTRTHAQDNDLRVITDWYRDDTRLLTHDELRQFVEQLYCRQSHDIYLYDPTHAHTPCSLVFGHLVIDWDQSCAHIEATLRAAGRAIVIVDTDEDYGDEEYFAIDHTLEERTR